MIKKTEAFTPKTGMNRNAHPSELKETEYTLALNANIQSAQGESDFILTNEPSNLKCTGFPEGTQVVKHYFDRVSNKTYFFLFNVNTLCSEIGYIDMNFTLDPSEVVLKECGCKLSVVIEDGLENIVQEGTCEYNRIITDYCEELEDCTGCLGFSFENPVIDVTIRHARSGNELYFTQKNKPTRYIKLSHIQEYFEEIDNCTGNIEEVCLKCEDLLVFNKFDFPCIKATTIQVGGGLRSGIYEVTVAYSDNDGTELSDYIAFTNYVSIFDKSNIILDQTSLDYTTNQSFLVDIDNLDKDYDYFKVVIIYRSGNEPAPKYVNFGVFPTSENQILVDSIPFIERGEELTEQKINKRRVHYLTAEGLENVGGYLFQHTLTQSRTLNLQPVVNLMGSMVKWGSSSAMERLYQNGIASANNKTYSRNETYPLSIRFKRTGGEVTDSFIFIARPPKQNEIAQIPKEDLNYISINSNVDNCATIARDRVWQYKNTAEQTGSFNNCPNKQTTETVEQQMIQSCESEPIIIEFGQLTEEIPGSIIRWINENNEFILNSTDPALDEIRSILENNDIFNTCTPDVEGCSEYEMISDSVIATAVLNQTVEDVSIPYNEYPTVSPPETCGACTQQDGSDCGFLVEPQERDSVIESYLPTGSIVYKKKPSLNTTCNTAYEATNALTGISFGKHLVDMGNNSDFSELLTNIPNSLTTVDFHPFLHSNVIFSKVTFIGEESIVIQISNIVCQNEDSNTNNRVRMSVYSGCPTLTEIPSYTRVIDMTTINDPDKFIVLNASDLAIGTSSLYITFDSPMRSDAVTLLTLSGTEGTSTITIGGVSMTATYNTSLTNTLNSFYTNNTSTFNLLGIQHENTPAGIRLRMTDEQFETLIITTDKPDLSFKIELLEEYNTLQPPCGCFDVFKRDVITETVTTFYELEFVRQIEYSSLCEVEIVEITSCDVTPLHKGTFSYVESEIKYPCNPELFNSQTLEIAYEDIPNSVRQEFEEYYTDGIISNNYVLTDETNFMNKSIRHYKMPDNIVSPFMSSFSGQNNTQNQYESLIHPIGFVIDNEVINAFLDIAVKNNLVTQDERDSIVGYEIFRGDRRGQKSVIGKGLAFDMLEYVDKARNNNGVGSRTYYPNYPLNDSTVWDELNGSLGTLLPAIKTSLTIHSPDTHYYKPTLPPELYIDGFQTGISSNTFSPLKEHPKYAVLGRRAIIASSLLAGLELTAEIAQAVAQATSEASAGTWMPAAILVAVTSVTLSSIAIPYRFNSYRYDWNNTFENLGTGFNHAYIGIAEGQYFNFLPNTRTNSILRGAEIVSYLTPGRKWVTRETVGDKVFVNNFQREQSVMFKTGSTTPFYYNNGLSDNSRLNIPTNQTGTLGAYETQKTFSPYVTMSQYLPSQYGSIYSIPWVNTGYCGNLNEDNDCDIIFGGDVYITRYAVKRKFPFFTETAHKLAYGDPFKYSSYFNINTGLNSNRGFLDFKTYIESFGNMVTVPFIKSGYSLWDGSAWVREDANQEFYIKDDMKFLTHYFGYPYFLVESELNCWYRYAGVEDHEHFYPQAGDIIDFSQISNVSMNEIELFRYNSIFSSVPHRQSTDLLPETYSRELWDKKDDLSNAVIYSQKDADNSLKRSPWLNYSALDFYNFSKEYGQLIDLRGIESEQLLVRFTDGFEIYGAVDRLRDRLTSSNYELGIGGIFSERAMSFNKTDLGYAGTQHKAIISTSFGHVWADSKRGKVFLLKPGGQGLEEISLSIDKWFKEQLPFKIVKKFVNVNIDRVYEGLGLSFGFDDRTKRVFLTKLDYIPKEGLLWDEENDFHIEEDGEIIKVPFSDSRYFEPAHFTVGYSFITEGWLSYYSFTPNYYNSYVDYFQTGVNDLINGNRNGLWTHHPMINSYQVFYGELFPFEVETSSKTNATNSLLESVNFFAEVRRYTNYYDYSDIFGKGFNKAYIYNQFQNSGSLNLIFQNNDDMQQWRAYPKANENSTDILQSEREGQWAFNAFYNLVKNERSGIPHMINDNVNINKYVNPLAVDYTPRLQNRLRGDYFIIKLIQDEFSQFKILFRLSKLNKQYYE